MYVNEESGCSFISTDLYQWIKRREEREGTWRLAPRNISCDNALQNLGKRLSVVHSVFVASYILTCEYKLLTQRYIP